MKFEQYTPEDNSEKPPEDGLLKKASKSIKKTVALGTAIGAGFFSSPHAKAADTSEGGHNHEQGIEQVERQDDAFSQESMKDFVGLVRKEAVKAVASDDEKPYRHVISEIDGFYQKVALTESFSPDQKKAVSETLSELHAILGTVESKLIDITSDMQAKVDQLSQNKETGTVYGIDIAEARGMVMDQDRGDVAKFDYLSKNAERLSRHLSEKMKELSEK